MIGILDAAVAAWQPNAEPTTKRPALPDKWKYLSRLSASNPLRPVRANVYEAMEALLALVWPASTPMSSTECSQKLRKDPLKRKHEKLDAQRKCDAENDGQGELERLWREEDDCLASGGGLLPLQAEGVEAYRNAQRERIEELLVREAQLYTTREFTEKLLVADFIKYVDFIQK